MLAPLSESASSLDELGRATALESSAVAAALTELELAGLVTAADGVYRRTIGGRSLA